jgi:enoyl-CoA hydratase
MNATSRHRDIATSGSRSDTVSKRDMLDLRRELLTLPVPVVARVDGAARAAGLGVLGRCDVVLASDGSTFAFTEVRLGLTPAVISLPLPPLISRPRGARMRTASGAPPSNERGQSPGTIGNDRMRIRPRAMVTTAPASKSSATSGRFAASKAARLT